MKVGIIGGRLQGTESAYLAKQAGYQTLLIDRNPEVPGASLADEFIVLDVINNYRRTGELLRSVDLIIPANEDILTLAKVHQLALEIDRPLAFDRRAYAVSSSKLTSNAFFQSLNIPVPAKWPNCRFPAILKPSNGSGSTGVRTINTERELKKLLMKLGSQPGNPVVEEFVHGPSLSLEVAALNGEPLALQVTELEFDPDYDCKRVLAGKLVDPQVSAELRRIGCNLAESLHLTGIMDVEVMVDNDIPKVIEIDARLPSQTPTAVLHSTGINMVELLAEILVKGKLPAIDIISKRTVIYEHIRVSGNLLEVTGEHIMASAGPLECHPDLYGFDQVITDFSEDQRKAWAATLISSAPNFTEAKIKRHQALKSLMAEHNLQVFRDPVPAEI
ncbi:3-methylornithine--L-lysine ligase PylC [Phosphitispora fastidiosa]|uniref:3-methylornithine--L-lysine ligase PylC n=1 Tax=Phosphitispora fastidiosa TaxID=2837202 RepID=UPI001E586AF6|nr:3-methylornithine--L-lysine ligase PylC [Phosphitispora fastidiosa]MBU7008389.1 pyrrolysine biosynthesis protein PylC [Phosphitispora fastidiosa]